MLQPQQPSGRNLSKLVIAVPARFLIYRNEGMVGLQGNPNPIPTGTASSITDKLAASARNRALGHFVSF